MIRKGKPYDLLAIKGTNRRYIEVKGSMNKPSNFRALLSLNEKKLIEQYQQNKSKHYRFHIVLGIGRFKEQIHKIFTTNKIPKPIPTNHYYITLPTKN